MNDEEFPNFTNRVVRLSRASEKEYPIKREIGDTPLMKSLYFGVLVVF